ARLHPLAGLRLEEARALRLPLDTGELEELARREDFRRLLQLAVVVLVRVDARTRRALRVRVARLRERDRQRDAVLQLYAVEPGRGLGLHLVDRQEPHVDGDGEATRRELGTGLERADEGEPGVAANAVCEDRRARHVE